MFPAPAQPATHRSLEERLEESLLKAQSAFEEKDYARAVNIVEQIPEPFRTDTLNELLDNARREANRKTVLEAMQRLFDNGEYDSVIYRLERIPEVLRCEESDRLLDEARKRSVILPVLIEARAAAARREFDRVIELLEPIDRPLRTDEIVSLLLDSHTAKLRYTELTAEFDAKYAKALEQKDPLGLTEAHGLLSQLAGLAPVGCDFTERLALIASQRDWLAKQPRLEQQSRAALEERNYRAVISLLKPMPEELRSEEIGRNLATALEAQAAIDRLLQRFREEMTAESLTGLTPILQELNELVQDAVQFVHAEIGNGPFRSLLARLVRQAETDPATMELLDLVLASLAIEDFAQLIASEGRGLCHLPERPNSVFERRLREVLCTLQQRPEHWRLELDALIDAQGQLTNRLPSLEEWRHLAQALDAFVQSSQQKFTWRHSLMTNPLVTALDESARQVTHGAAAVLPEPEERWNQLQPLAPAAFEGKTRLHRRLFRKMQKGLKLGNYSDSSLTLLTPQRLIHGTGALAGASLLGLAVALIMEWVFGVGGATGFGMVIFLTFWWTFFCRTASRILDG